MNLKAIAIIIFTLSYLYKLTLSVINLRSENNPIPENVSDVYDHAAYERWRAYHNEKNRFDMISSFASYIVDVLLLVFNVYAAFAGLFRFLWCTLSH